MSSQTTQLSELTDGSAPPQTKQQTNNETVVLTREQEKARKMRNYLIAATLLGFAALVFIVTIVRLGENVADRTF